MHAHDHKSYERVYEGCSGSTITSSSSDHHQATSYTDTMEAHIERRPMVRVGLPDVDQCYGALRRPWHVHGPVVHDVLGCVYLSHHPPDGSLEYMGFPEVPIADEHRDWLSFLLRDPAAAAASSTDHLRWSRLEQIRLHKLTEWRHPEIAELRQKGTEPECQQLTHKHQGPWVHFVMGYLRLKRIRTLWSFLGKHLSQIKEIGRQVNAEEEAKQEARDAWEHLVTGCMQNAGFWEKEADDERSHPQQRKGTSKGRCLFNQLRSTHCKGAAAAAAKGKGKSKARPSHRG